MRILVEADLAPSIFVHDSEHDWRDIHNDRVHIALRCRHENIGLDLDTDGMYCPDCDNEDLTEEEESQYYQAYTCEGDLSDYGEEV